MNRRQWISIIGFNLVALAAGVATSHWIFRSEPADDPAIKAFFANPWQTPTGKSVDTKEWREKGLVINFWASW